MHDTYPRRFFHQLISSQLDVDRLDYLKRDCFFTGVLEGTIGAGRIIKMLDIVNDQLVVEEKGIYSIENFLSSRRLMYWQVYLHKTTISADEMMIQVIRRARHLAQNGQEVFTTPALELFIRNNVTLGDFERDPAYLHAFTSIDDYDIWASVKMWATHRDYVLATISRMLLDRKIFKVILSADKPGKTVVREIEQRLRQQYNLNREHLKYFVIQGSTSNAAYISEGESINILTKKGQVIDIAEASDLPNIKAMTKLVKKYYLCWPKLLPESDPIATAGNPITDL
jgi:uncharacterized protein